MADDEGTEAHRVIRQAKASLAALVVLSVCLLVVASVVIWAELREHPAYDPLHYTNPQSVTSRVNALSGAPATHIDGTVNVTGEKCADETVAIQSVTSWQPVDPRGTTIDAGEGSAIREAGCVVSRYENQIPDAVTDAVRRQHARGILAPLWVLSGAETPIATDGRAGSVEVWTTEPFAIVP